MYVCSQALRSPKRTTRIFVRIPARVLGRFPKSHRDQMKIRLNGFKFTAPPRVMARVYLQLK